jgi:hypothetical protein
MILRRRFLVGGLASAALAQTAVAAEPPKRLNNWDMSGTIGPYRIGLNATIRDYRQFVTGYYFYASKLIDIPLAGGQQGETLILTEPGGGVFRLNLFSNGPQNEPLTFYTSVGLRGSWTDGARTLPVSLDFEGETDGDAPTHRYADVTDRPDAQFEARVRAFLKAALAGDRAAAAQLVSYPLRINHPRTRLVRNRAELLAQWNGVFTPKVIAALRAGVPHNMFVRNGMAMLGSGIAWFDDKGLAVLNPV